MYINELANIASPNSSQNHQPHHWALGLKSHHKIAKKLNAL